jgi:hypothetical protein
MTSHVASQIPRSTKIGFLRLLGEILALAAEGSVMAMLMVMAGVCALGSLIGVLIVKSNLYRRITG